MLDYAAIDERKLDAIYRQTCGELAEDPLEWVKWAYDWDYGELSGHHGPDVWQAGFLRDWGEEIRLRGFDGHAPVMPYLTSTVSGHGVGKSGLVSMVSGFILSTRPFCRGRVTANSIPQLETTTWPEIVKWMRRCKTRRWFRMTSGRGAMKIVHRNNPETWRLDGMAWDASRPAAFAGLHASTSTVFYILDEASEVPRIICETAQGGLTDGEPMMFMFSNPTKASGYFFDSHHEMRHRFKTYNVDSRTARMTNKVLINQWIEDHGLDSDFVKVRVLGEFPVTSDKQFIPSNIVTAARDEKREVLFSTIDPIIVGVDVARFGSDETTVYIRRGRTARWKDPMIFRGLDTHQLSLRLKALADDIMPDAINVDGGGGLGGAVVDNLRNWQVPNVNEVHFGGVSPEDDYADMATYMMASIRKWLQGEGVTIPNDPVLSRQLTSREYKMVQGKRGTAIKIESKDEMREHQDKKESPDRADGLGLTFAVPVGPRDVERTRREISGERFSNVVGID